MNVCKFKEVLKPIKYKLKSIEWRNLTDAELDRSMADRQVISNCYDEATRYALLSSEKGREILKQRIQIQSNGDKNPAYRVKLNVDGQEKIYEATAADYFGKDFDMFRTYMKEISPDEGLATFDYSNSRLSLGVGVAINKMIKEHPDKKSLISRLHKWPFIANYLCEYNKPSNAFKWYTGMEPIVIGESTLNINLKKSKEEVMKLLRELGEMSSKKFSFVALTGLFKAKGISAWHTLPIVKVDGKEETLSVLNKRTNVITDFSFEEFINKFKAIVGIKFQ